MKAFLISMLLLVVISVGAWFVLDNFERTAEGTYISENVRLD